MSADVVWLLGYQSPASDSPFRTARRFSLGTGPCDLAIRRFILS